MNERKYVVIASYALSGAFMMNLLGIANCWPQAFRLIDGCDYKKVVDEEVDGAWSEYRIPSKSFSTESNGKVSYTETHDFKCEDDSEAMETSVMFTIFEY